jgi:hypothetical protein
VKISFAEKLEEIRLQLKLNELGRRKRRPYNLLMHRGWNRRGVACDGPCFLHKIKCEVEVADVNVVEIGRLSPLRMEAKS